MEAEEGGIFLFPVDLGPATPHAATSTDRHLSSSLKQTMVRPGTDDDKDYIMTIDDEEDDENDARPDLDMEDEDEELQLSMDPAEDQPRGRQHLEPSTTFSSFNLSRPLLKAIEAAGFVTPTPIQSAAIPLILGGGDVCGSAVTGSGKTAAFMIPIIERLVLRPRRIAATVAVVIIPTRELAVQCEAMTRHLCRYLTVHLCCAVGGLSLKAQEVELRKRPDVVIATPGRLIDLARNTMAAGMESVEVLVLDEADRLLDLGFHDEITEIIRMMPSARQTLLFTATMSDAVEKLIAASCNRPNVLRVDKDMGVSSTLHQEFVRVNTATSVGDVANDVASLEREAAVLSLCTRVYQSGVLIFARSRSQAHRLATIMRLCQLQVGKGSPRGASVQWTC